MTDLQNEQVVHILAKLMVTVDIQSLHLFEKCSMDW